MTTEALLDVNVLIATLFTSHEHHHRALRFVDGLEHFYSCPTTQGGFLRYATRPVKQADGVLRPALNIREAHADLVAFTRRQEHVFLPDDLSFIGLSLRSLTGHKQWTDAYLLGLARKHRLNLATFDGRMSSLDDPDDPVRVLIPV